jgi:hypothetical protein
MPYVEGESLKERLAREGPLPIESALRVLREVADALSCAHRRGIVHRDVKPANLLFEDGHVLVSDFGIAMALGLTGGTSTGTAIGTLDYMAPEQAAGDPAIDHRADLYALGVVGHELVTGKLPYDAELGVPEVPPRLAALLQQLLERRPAARPPSADDVVRHLDTLLVQGAGSPPARPAGTSRRARWLLGGVAGGGLLAAAVLAAPNVLHPRGFTLDSNRIMVFPLAVSGSAVPQAAGEDVATVIGYALEGTAPLRWLEAMDDLSAGQRAALGRLDASARATISRARRAAFYIDGSIVQRGDSATVVLRLHSVAGDSVVARAGASGVLAGRHPSDLGLRSVGRLLAALIDPGRDVDLSAVADRRPDAVAAFLQGERAYRASHFVRALEHYQEAVRIDTLFALAALKGAQAASWLDRDDDAARLAHRALAQVALLPAHKAAYVRGLAGYLGGAADSAVAGLEAALSAAYTAEDSATGWMALGEVYHHLLPDVAAPDSLAEAAFATAWALDPDFTPPLFHLTELALRRGDLARADTLFAHYESAAPDSSLQRLLSDMLQCVHQGGAGVDWEGVARSAPIGPLQAGLLLSGGVPQPARTRCARDAWWAVMRSGGATAIERYAALFALQSQLLAADRHAEAVALLRTPPARALGAEVVLLLDGSGGAPVQREAAEVAGRLGQKYPGMASTTLWLLGQWEAHTGSGDRLRAIAGALAARADSFRTHADSARLQGTTARLVLAEGDTAAAIRLLRALTPSAPRADLLWYPWESFTGERLLLARLLLARRDLAGADKVASQLEGPQAVAHLLYLRPALALRARVAEALGEPGKAARYQRRLAELALDRTPVPWILPSERSTR